MNDTKSISVKRIAVVGPECSGKTHLSMALAEHYRTVWVPEYARYYIDHIKRSYKEEDLQKIAQMQMLSEDELAQNANQLLICDTNLVVMKVWSEFRFGRCHPEILEQINYRSYSLHLLTNVDIPWENDPQREHPDKREYFYKVYKNELEALGVNYVEISGDENTRVKTAINAIDSSLK